jgi:hypothetical protein
LTIKEMITRQQEITSLARSEGRDLTAEETREFNELQEKIDAARAAEPESQPAEPAAQPADAVREAREAERRRISDIGGLCRSFGIDPQPYIDNGSSMDECRRLVLDELQRRTPQGIGGIYYADESAEDRFREAAADGLRMRMGQEVARPADGAGNFSGMSLRDLAIECLSRDGGQTASLLRMGKDELYGRMSRDFFNPAASFPAIMDAAIRKTIVEEYQKVPTTFQAWTRKGSVTDFKATPDHSYLLGGVGDFELVPENGELKNSIPQTALLPQRKIDTYGKQFSMSRQAFINDDIGFLSEIPAAYTRAAKRTIDKAVYAILVGNPAVYDGVALFHQNHKNLIDTGAAPAQTTIQDIILLAQGQTDPFGDPIYEVPKFLIVPMGYEFTLAAIFRSAQVLGSPNNDINPLYNYPLQVIQTPWINALVGAAAKPWFMVTDPSSSKSIQVDYLNGQETPTFRRSEPAGQLGFVWDIWLDWGITVVDYRGIYKNPGKATP